ncbi:hypothetical protein BN1708_019858, partial [Verticillium longisporum]
TEQL